MRRERNNSNHSDDLSQKRNRMDNGILGNNNNLDAINHMPQITATDFSTHLKHNNNTILPHIKDTDRHETKTPNGKFQLHFTISFFCRGWSGSGKEIRSYPFFFSNKIQLKKNGISATVQNKSSFSSRQ